MARTRPNGSNQAGVYVLRACDCGHCGCALVAEKKKGRYVYYHCTGKCFEPYTREEVRDECFAESATQGRKREGRLSYSGGHHDQQRNRRARDCAHAP
jgi:hypothetical protein